MKHIALRLCGRTEELEDAEQTIAKRKSARIARWYLWFIHQDKGHEQIVAETVKDLSSPMGWFYWWSGVEAELQGDLPAAIKAYENSTNVTSDVTNKYLAGRWARQLRAQISPATEPSSLPAD